MRWHSKIKFHLLCVAWCDAISKTRSGAVHIKTSQQHLEKLNSFHSRSTLWKRREVIHSLSSLIRDNFNVNEQVYIIRKEYVLGLSSRHSNWNPSFSMLEYYLCATKRSLLLTMIAVLFFIYELLYFWTFKQFQNCHHQQVFRSIFIYILIYGTLRQAGLLQCLPKVWERMRESNGERRFSLRSQQSNFRWNATIFFLCHGHHG